MSRFVSRYIKMTKYLLEELMSYFVSRSLRRQNITGRAHVSRRV